MLAVADVAVTASGTATVQTALHGVPMVVVYKLSPMTYRLGRRFVHVDTFAMANLIAGRRIVPELIQDECTPGGGDARSDLVSDGSRTRRTDKVRAARGPGETGAPRRERPRAADAVLRVAKGRPTGRGAVAPRWPPLLIGWSYHHER